MQADNSDAARLRDEQARSEQAAADASVRERDLAAKLAAAEAERQRLTQELAQRTADQALRKRATGPSSIGCRKSVSDARPI